MQASLRAPIVLLMPRFRINANGVSQNSVVVYGSK
jgi:hypothetical protein